MYIFLIRNRRGGKENTKKDMNWFVVPIQACNAKVAKGRLQSMWYFVFFFRWGASRKKQSFFPPSHFLSKDDDQVLDDPPWKCWNNKTLRCFLVQNKKQLRMRRHPAKCPRPSKGEGFTSNLSNILWPGPAPKNEQQFTVFFPHLLGTIHTPIPLKFQLHSLCLGGCFFWGSRQGWQNYWHYENFSFQHVPALASGTHTWHSDILVMVCAQW